MTSPCDLDWVPGFHDLKSNHTFWCNLRLGRIPLRTQNQEAFDPDILYLSDDRSSSKAYYVCLLCHRSTQTLWWTLFRTSHCLVCALSTSKTWWSHNLIDSLSYASIAHNIDSTNFRRLLYFLENEAKMCWSLARLKDPDRGCDDLDQHLLLD